MRAFIERVASGFTAGTATVRRRYRLVDHVWRARERYSEVYGGRLAAAISYYGFFAAFALAVLLFAVLGWLLQGNDVVTDAVQQYLRRNLPQVNVATLITATGRLGAFATIGLALTGVAWVESLRSSQRAIWHLDQQPGHPVVRWLIDVAVLIGLGVLLVVSVMISSGLQDVVLALAGQAEQSQLRSLLRGFGGVFAVAVDLVLGAALLAGVPRLRMSLRRLVPSAALIALGLWLLKTAGKWYVARTQHNPAYQLVYGAVGLLVFMYLFNQIILHAAALAATSEAGTVVDLAAGPKPQPVADEDDEAAGTAEPAERAEPAGRAERAEPAGRAERAEPAEPAERARA